MNAAALTGRKIRRGLKTVITLSRIRKKLVPSDTSRIFDRPTRVFVSIGSNRTL